MEVTWDQGQQSHGCHIRTIMKDKEAKCCSKEGGNSSLACSCPPPIGCNSYGQQGLKYHHFTPKAPLNHTSMSNHWTGPFCLACDPNLMCAGSSPPTTVLTKPTSCLSVYVTLLPSFHDKTLHREAAVYLINLPIPPLSHAATSSLVPFSTLKATWMIHPGCPPDRS